MSATVWSPTNLPASPSVRQSAALPSAGAGAETLQEDLFVDQPLPEDLQRHVSPQNLVARQVDLGHAPAPEAAEDLVAAVAEGSAHRGSLPPRGPPQKAVYRPLLVVLRLVFLGIFGFLSGAGGRRSWGGRG